MNKTITPEVILHKFSDRLKRKRVELEYLAYMDKQFEKWLQYELVLAFSDIALPVVFNENFNEITHNEDGKKEKVCDITTEFPIDGKDPQSTIDVIIAENPFLLELADEETWQVSKDDVRECKEKYLSTKFHYVELKQRNWVAIKSSATITSLIVDDLSKFSHQNRRTFKPAYNPSSAISICCVSFWDPKDPSRLISRSEVARIVEKVGKRALEECDRHYGKGGSWLWESISKEVLLLMVFYNL